MGFGPCSTVDCKAHGGVQLLSHGPLPLALGYQLPSSSFRSGDGFSSLSIWPSGFANPAHVLGDSSLLKLPLLSSLSGPSVSCQYPTDTELQINSLKDNFERKGVVSAVTLLDLAQILVLALLQLLQMSVTSSPDNK